MRTVILDPPTAGLDELLERRRRSGLDRLDEVWEGELHMVPAPTAEHALIGQQLAEILGPIARAAGLICAIQEFNLGESEHDFRVPDGGLPFYAAHQVDELLIVDSTKRTVDWLGLQNGEYRAIERSSVIELGRDELAARLQWPPIPAD